MASMDLDEDLQVTTEAPVARDYLLRLAQLKHEWVLYSGNKQDPKLLQVQDEMKQIIQEHDMAPYYTWVCEQLSWKADEKLLEEMKKKNAEKLAALEAKKKDAEENLGDLEVRDARFEIVNHFHSIGDLQNATEQIDQLIAEKKMVGVSPRLDLLFQKIRLGMAFGEAKMVKENIDAANDILKKESDWERRNRLKVYEGLYCLTTRNWQRAIELFLDGVATFSAYELMEYKDFIWYTVFAALARLSRPQLKEKILKNAEVVTTLPDVPKMNALLNALYDSRYGDFMEALEEVCRDLEKNMWLSTHTNFYFRELRVLAFRQFLASYRSVSLQHMADSFKMPVGLLEGQLQRFIASNQLDCKIDKVSGQVITRKRDQRNANYQQLIEKGDILLNKITKVARVVGV